MSARTFMMVRLAWWWSDWTSRKSARFAIVAAAAVFAALYVSSLLIALAFGDGLAFLRDFRWPAAHLIVALSAHQLSRLPGEIDRLWLDLGPWLANSENQIAEVRGMTRSTLARYFVPSAAVWVVFVCVWIVTRSWGGLFASPALAPILNAIYGFGALWYFLGASVSFSGVGLWILFRRLDGKLAFRSDLVTLGGRAALRPFARLLGGVWRYFLSVIVLAGICTAPVGGESLRIEDIVLWSLILVLVAIRFSTQGPINNLLTTVKARTVRDLRDRLERERSAAEAAPEEVVRSLHRVQILLHDLRTAENFAPSLVDTRFVVQIVLSVTATLIANVLLRTVLARLLGF